MDWFKHKTGSHTDPDICAAIDEFGDTGYTAFFVILEVYGREFNSINDDGWLRVSQTFLRRKLRKSWTKVELLLNFYQTKNRIFFTIEGSDVLLKIPLFIELASTWARRRSRDEQASPPEGPPQGPLAREVEVEEEEERSNTTAIETNEFFTVTETEHATYQKAFVITEDDLRRQYAKMVLYCKRKGPLRDYRRFIYNWLEREYQKLKSLKEVNALVRALTAKAKVEPKPDVLPTPKKDASAELAKLAQWRKDHPGE